MRFLEALARAFSRALAVTAYVLYSGAQWLHGQTASGSDDVAEEAAAVEESADDEEARAYRLWVAEQCRLAAANRAARKPDAVEKARLERAGIAYAQASMRGEPPHPDNVSEFFDKHGAPDKVDDETKPPKP